MRESQKRERERVREKNLGEEPEHRTKEAEAGDADRGVRQVRRVPRWWGLG